MRKKLLLAGLLLAVSINLSAQYKEFGFGMKMGPSLQWAGSKTNTVTNESTKMGFKWGFLAEYYFVENYAIVSGFNVNYIRGNYSFDDTRNISIDTVSIPYEGNANRMFKGTYFEIPVLIKMRTEPFGPFNFFAEVGGSVGFCQKALAMDDFTTELGTSSDDDYASVAKQYNPIRANFIVLGGVEYVIKGSTRAFADLSYNRDLLNGMSYKYARKYLYADDAERVGDNLDLRENGFSLEVGVLF